MQETVKPIGDAIIQKLPSFVAYSSDLNLIACNADAPLAALRKKSWLEVRTFYSFDATQAVASPIRPFPAK